MTSSAETVGLILTVAIILQMNGADSDRIKQKEYYDRQIMQLQKQCVQMASEVRRPCMLLQ